MLPLRTAVLLADPATALALTTRLPVVAETAARLGLPPATVERLVERGELDHVTALALPDDTSTPLGILFAAARLGDSVSAAAVLKHLGRLDADDAEQLLNTVLDHVDPEDPGFLQRPFGQQIRQLSDRHGPYVALRYPLPYFAYARARTDGADLPLSVALTLCARLAELAGPAGLLELADHAERAPESEGAIDLDVAHPGIAAVLRDAAAAPDPVAHLTHLRDDLLNGELKAWAEPEAVSALFRLRRRGGSSVTPPTVAMDWDALRAEIARRPLTEDQHADLAQWPGLPDDLLETAVRANPNRAIHSAARLPYGLLTVESFSGRYVSRHSAVRRGVTIGSYDPDRLFDTYTSGRDLLEALPYELPVVRDAVARRFAVLGEEPTAWLTLYNRLSHANGTVAALLDDVVTRVRTKPVTTWTRPLDAKYPAPEPDNTRLILLDLLSCLPDSVTVVLAPHLDARAVQQILVHRDVTPTVRDALVAAHGPDALTWYAGGGELTRPERVWLLEQDDDGADGRLLGNSSVPAEELARILAGRRRDGSTRDRVPQPVLDMMRELNLGHYRSHLTAGIVSGDPGVAAVIVERLRFHTDAGPLRLALAVWDRAGADALRELLAGTDRLPAAARKHVEKALAAEDPAVLREALDAAASPANVLRQLLKRARTDAWLAMKSLTDEGDSLPWAELTASAGTLPADLATRLAARPDAPRAYVVAVLPHLREGWSSDPSWLVEALRRGAVTGEDVVERARHTAEIHRLFTDVRDARPFTPVAYLRRLAAEHLGSHPDAWAVALQLAPDFTGTVTELLSVAAAAACG